MKLFKLNTPSSPKKTREQRQKELLFVWSKNKGTYLTISGILLLISLLLINFSAFQIFLVDSGNARWATIVNIKDDDGGYRQLGETYITVQYRDDGAYTEEKIRLPLSGHGFFVGEKIPIIQDPETGIIVVNSKSPYIFNLLLGIFVLIPCLFSFFYHFLIFKKRMKAIKGGCALAKD